MGPRERLTSVRVLDVDPDLGERLSSADFEEARDLCRARLVRLPSGPIDWNVTEGPVPLGLLVLRGVLRRRIVIDDRHAAEVLGPGDLLRPWSTKGEATIASRTAWRVLEPAAVAVLDAGFRRCADRWPDLMDVLLDRVYERSRSLLLRLAVVQFPKNARRVHLILWQLADRWGQVVPEGVVLRMRLTPTALADLVSTSRESVSRALAELADHDLAHVLAGGGYLLRGQSPADLHAGLDAAGPRARKA